LAVNLAESILAGSFDEHDFSYVESGVDVVTVKGVKVTHTHGFELNFMCDIFGYDERLKRNTLREWKVVVRNESAKISSKIMGDFRMMADESIRSDIHGSDIYRCFQMLYGPKLSIVPAGAGAIELSSHDFPLTKLSSRFPHSIWNHLNYDSVSRANAAIHPALLTQADHDTARTDYVRGVYDDIVELRQNNGIPVQGEPGFEELAGLPPYKKNTR